MDPITISRLRADCASCPALCCVAPAFAASADFAVDKAAGKACPNLQTDFRCGIHPRLRGEGFRGCTVYDCFGAGQRVAQVSFGGRDWRRSPDLAEPMFAVFAVMRQLHELLWYLTEALTMQAARPIHPEVSRLLGVIERHTHDRPESLLALDVAVLQAEVSGVLRHASALARAEIPGRRLDRRGADLIGADLTGADLRGADLRGAYLIGAVLRRADLRGADLIGVDFRDTDLSGADLTGSIFLTQAQLAAAKGDSATRLPSRLSRPEHWSWTE